MRTIRQDCLQLALVFLIMIIKKENDLEYASFKSTSERSFAYLQGDVCSENRFRSIWSDTIANLVFVGPEIRDEISVSTYRLSYLTTKLIMLCSLPLLMQFYGKRSLDFLFAQESLSKEYRHFPPKVNQFLNAPVHKWPRISHNRFRFSYYFLRLRRCVIKGRWAYCFTLSLELECRC
jgi:hypothetical protein